MDVREKMVELLSEKCMETCKQRKGYVCSVEECKRCKEKCCGFYADHLISNGVTVQEWISVDDNLPEVVSIQKVYRSTVKKSIRVLCVCVQKSGKTMVKEGYCEWYNDYQEPRWKIPGTIDEVTHWQYLPQPPKGE